MRIQNLLHNIWTLSMVFTMIITIVIQIETKKILVFFIIWFPIWTERRNLNLWSRNYLLDAENWIDGRRNFTPDNEDSYERAVQSSIVNDSADFN